MEQKQRVRIKGMKFYNDYFLCKKLRPLLDNVVIDDREKRNGIYSFRNWREIKNVILRLREIKSLTSTIDEVYNSFPVIAREQSEPTVDENVKTNVKRNIAVLTQKMDTIIALGDRFEGRGEHIGIDIKLPQSSSLEEYINNLKDLNFIFTQCPQLSRVEGTDIKWGGVDTGSDWITFFFVGAGFIKLLENVSALVDCAMIVKSHLITYKQQEENLQAMKQKNSIGQEIIDVYKKLKDKMLDDEREKFEQITEQGEDGEERDKTKKTLEKLAVLIDKGLEIYTTIETPEDVQAKFPTIKPTASLEDGLIKLIEKKEDNE